MTTWEKLQLPDGYARLNLREWVLGATPTGKSLIMQEMRKLNCENIMKKRGDFIWIDETSEATKDEIKREIELAEVRKELDAWSKNEEMIRRAMHSTLLMDDMQEGEK